MEAEKLELEGEVTLQELNEALEKSNFSSMSGWDGLSFKVLRKFWDQLGTLMSTMARETFNGGELTETFKMGLIKIIPKKDRGLAANNFTLLWLQNNKWGGGKTITEVFDENYRKGTERFF